MTHPDQPWLPDHIAVEWLAALAAAGIDPDTAVLVALPGTCFDGSSMAMYLQPEDLAPEKAPLPTDVRAMLNRDDLRIDGVRVLAWLDGMNVENIAALLRHELEHARQFGAYPGLIYPYDGIYDLIQPLPESGKLYQTIPVEADANAAAAVHIRNRFGAARIDELAACKACPAGAIFRTPPNPPPPADTLLDRMQATLRHRSAEAATADESPV